MTRTLILAAMLAATPLSAMAESARFTDVNYLAASRCLAYASAPQLQADPFNPAGLREAVEAQTRGRVTPVLDRAETDAHNIQRQLNRADNAREIERLRDARDEACAPYVQNGLVQSGAALPPA